MFRCTGGSGGLNDVARDGRLTYSALMRVAFKEWAVVVDALGSGVQAVILRKGGISEGRRGFQVEHAEFFLFPTMFHQQRESVLPTAQAAFDATALLPDPAKVRLDFFAHVVSWRRLDSLPAVERLRGQHIWRDEVIAQRFDWGQEKNIYALAVRVFRLPAPVELLVLPSYAGCKSWVDLEQEISTEAATPVLSKEVFNEKLNQFHAALDAEAGPDNGSPAP
jgi:hypothetical protein